MSKYGGRRVQQLRRFVWDNYPHICHWCKRPLQFATYTVEHIVPRSLGGDDSLENCKPACGSRASGGCGENFRRGNDVSPKRSRRVDNRSFFKK